MLLVSKKYLNFDSKDVQLMKDMMKKFHELHRGTGMPDFSINYAGYLPVFALSLLAAQNTIDKLTKGLFSLTFVLTILTCVLVFK